MINIKQIKCTIEPIESNSDSDSEFWHTDSCVAWLGLSELQSIPSLFIEFTGIRLAIPIQDLETLLNMPILRKLKDSYEPPRVN